MPKGLYARALLIIIAPMVVLQSVVAFMFMERHYNLVTQRLSAGVVQDIATLIEVYKVYPQDADNAQLRRIAQDKLGLVVDFLPVNDLPPPGPKPFFSLVDQALSEEVRKQIGRPFWIDTVGRSALLEIRIKLDNAVMRVFAPRSAAYVSNSHIFLGWMVGTSLVLITVAVLFLRNQIRPILRLADAAESFGKGREVPDFRPRGAREVRRAAQAFIEMKSRIERTMEQRTAMLAGVSHDLRTILTRFKLELALIGDSPEVEAMKKDVDEMGRMLEAYLAFARGDSGEQSAPDRHGRLPGGAQDRRRAQRPQVERQLPRPSDRHGAAQRLQALPRQSGLERGAPCALDLDHRPPRPPLADRHRRRRRPRNSAAAARGGVQAVPAARRRPQPGRGRHRPRARHRARHRPLPWRRHRAVGQPAGRAAGDGAGAGLTGLGLVPHSAIAADDATRARSRRTNFWILPVAVVGSGPNTTDLGALKCASWSRQKAMISSAVAFAARLELHEGAGRLAPFLIGPRHHRRKLHRRMPVERDLDLDARNVLAARDDDVLGAVLDLDIAVGVLDREVAGVHPAAAERFGRRLGLLQIAEHHGVAAHHDLADGLAVARHRLRGVFGSATMWPSTTG